MNVLSSDQADPYLLGGGSRNKLLYFRIHEYLVVLQPKTLKSVEQAFLSAYLVAAAPSTLLSSLCSSA